MVQPKLTADERSISSSSFNNKSNLNVDDVRPTIDQIESSIYNEFKTHLMKLTAPLRWQVLTRISHSLDYTDSVK